MNQKAVARHMPEMGLEAVSPGPHLSRRAHQAGSSPYVLTKSVASTPKPLWGIDITSIRLSKGWMDLVAVLDWYPRYVGRWEGDQTLPGPCVLQAVTHAFETATPDLWNRDQGSHVTRTPSLPLVKENTPEHSRFWCLDNGGRYIQSRGRSYHLVRFLVRECGF